MTDNLTPTHQGHAFNSFNPKVEEGLVMRTRRNMLKASVAGIAGLSVPGLLRAADNAVSKGHRYRCRSRRAIRGILPSDEWI